MDEVVRPADFTNFSDYCFVEALDGEPDSVWLDAVVGMLLTRTALASLTTAQLPPMAAGPTVRWSDRPFRSLRCYAGSVHANLEVAAMRADLPRGLIMTGVVARTGEYRATAWLDGREVEFDARELAV